METTSNNRIKILKGRVVRNVYYQNVMQEVEFSIYKSYIGLLGIPIIPLGKSYTARIMATGEFFGSGRFGNMPEDLLEIVKDISRVY